MVLFGTGAKLIASTSEATITIESTPPELSTGSVPSLMWLGIRRTASTSATTASGSVSRKTEPHEWCSSSAPDSTGPRAEMAPPMPDHSAIERVRPGPDQSAVISASVVGNAIPAARPPKSRAPMRMPMFDAVAAMIEAGIASSVPASSIILRP